MPYLLTVVDHPELREVSRALPICSSARDGTLRGRHTVFSLLRRTAVNAALLLIARLSWIERAAGFDHLTVRYETWYFVHLTACAGPPSRGFMRSRPGVSFSPISRLPVTGRHSIWSRSCYLSRSAWCNPRSRASAPGPVRGPILLRIRFQFTEPSVVVGVFVEVRPSNLPSHQRIAVGDIRSVVI